jgi:alginate O-acetyltransferase complex protein AlgI
VSVPEITPWTRLFLISLALFVACKWLTYRRALRSAKAANLRRRLGYWLLWPGMDARTFLDPGQDLRRPAGREWLAAVAKTLAGAILVGVVARQVPPTCGFWRDWTVLIGLGLCVPFGALHLVALGWQAAGVNARPIMDRPFVASSLSEFWGRRWNRAFRDIAHDLVFWPLARKLGPGRAVAAAFLFSGLFHELTLSVPAVGGFGGPTAYFLLQLVGVYMERSAVGTRLGLRHGWRGRIFCWAVTVSPACAVFHRPLLDNVVLPWLGAMGLL